MTSSTKPNLLPYFPDEILLHWMSFLPPKDLKNSRLACRRFARAGIEPLLHTLTLTTSTQSRSAFSKVKDDEDARRFVRKVSIVIRLPGVCWPTLAPKRLPVLADIDHFPALKHTALQVEVPMCQDRRSYRLIIKALGLNPSLRQADSPSSMLVLLPLVLTQLTLHCSVNNPGLVTFLPTKWRMPGLKSLTLGNFILGSHGHVDWIVSHKETLKELYLDSCPLVQLVVQSDDTYGGQVSIEENRRFERTFKDITSTSLGDSRNSMRVEPFTKSTAIHLNRSWREMIAHFHEYLPNLEKFGVTQGSWHVGHSSEPLNGRDKQHLLAWRGTSASVSSHCMLRNQRGSRCFHRKATENFLSKNDPMVYVVEEVGTIRSRASAVAYPSTVEEDRTAINDFVKHLARKSANRTQYRSFQGSNFEEPSIWTPVKPERLLRMTYARTHHDIFPYHQDWVQIMSLYVQDTDSAPPLLRTKQQALSCLETLLKDPQGQATAAYLSGDPDEQFRRMGQPRIISNIDLHFYRGSLAVGYKRKLMSMGDYLRLLHAPPGAIILFECHFPVWVRRAISYHVQTHRVVRSVASTGRSRHRFSLEAGTEVCEHIRRWDGMIYGHIIGDDRYGWFPLECVKKGRLFSEAFINENEDEDEGEDEDEDEPSARKQRCLSPDASGNRRYS